MTYHLRAFLAAGLLLGAARGAAAQAQDRETSAVFDRFSNRVVKVQVVAGSSGARSSIGSGWFATPDGHVVTNYHVVSALLNTPGRYRVDVIDVSGDTVEATILAVDAVHDLAILGTGLRDRRHFAPDAASVAQGSRLYALGHPRDLPLSIVEGTYNGLLSHTLYQRIHFTGSLNPGMSGGPTIDRAGRVIGVNVATEGNQVSYLVPVSRVQPLLREALAGDSATPTLEAVAAQLRAHNAAYLAGIFDSASSQIELGPFRVPSRPTPYFRCWGDIDDEPDLTYESSTHHCSTDDEVYLDWNQSTGTVWLRHQLISATELNTPRFIALYSSLFGGDNSAAGVKEHVTSWKCVTRNVRTGKTGETRVRAVSCLRRYRKLGELYDSFLQVATLGSGETGLVSTLNVLGVSFDDATRLSQRFLEAITWR